MSLAGTCDPTVSENSYLRVTAWHQGVGQLPQNLQMVSSKGSVVKRAGCSAETLLWFPAPTGGLTTICNSNSRGSGVLSGH